MKKLWVFLLGLCFFNFSVSTASSWFNYQAYKGEEAKRFLENIRTLFQEKQYQDVIDISKDASSGYIDENYLPQDEYLYIVALSYINIDQLSKAEETLNKIIDNTNESIMLEKVKLRLEEIKEIYRQRKKLDSVSDDLFPYSEVIGEDKSKEFKNKYIEALNSYKLGDYQKAERTAYYLKYEGARNYKLLYNIAFMSHKVGNNKQAIDILREIKDNANVSYKEKNPDFMDKVEALYEKLKKIEKEKKEPTTEEKKEKEEGKNQSSSAIIDIFEVQKAKIALGAKAPLVETIADAVKKKDKATQEKFDNLIKIFIESKDNYTRNIGIYLQYLLQ